MRIRTCLRYFFKSFDLFSTTSFLRYKRDDSYNTASGGITSLIVITIFMVLFANTAILTLNKSIINWTSTTENFFEPSETKLSMSPEDNFMFTIGIMGIDLNDPTRRYFDIQIVDTHVGAGGVILGANFIDLEPCTREHFSMSQKLMDNYENMAAARRLCPPMNYSTTIYGKFTSKEMQYTQIRLQKCNSSLNPSRPCVNDSVIDNLISVLGQFTLGMFYVNPLINPGSQDYLDYYFQDRNFLTFTKDLGSYSIGRIQDYVIQTDESLHPFVQNRVDSGIIIPELFQTIPYQVTNDNYASFYLMKSASKATYSRSFNKLDQLFSYVGGLIGTILGVMLFMGNFTLMSFELDISKRLMKYKDENIDFSDFNLISFILYQIYRAGKYFGFFKNWQQMKKRSECKEEMLKQLDITLFLRRISFLERSIEHLMGSNDKKDVFYSLETIKDIKCRRKKYKIMEKESSTQKNAEESDSSDSDDSKFQSKEGKEGNLSSKNEILNQSLEKVDFTHNPSEVIFRSDQKLLPSIIRKKQKRDHDKKIQKISDEREIELINPLGVESSEGNMRTMKVEPGNTKTERVDLQKQGEEQQQGEQVYFEEINTPWKR